MILVYFCDTTKENPAVEFAVNHRKIPYFQIQKVEAISEILSLLASKSDKNSLLYRFFHFHTKKIKIRKKIKNSKKNQFSDQK